MFTSTAATPKDVAIAGIAGAMTYPKRKRVYRRRAGPLTGASGSRDGGLISASRR